MILLSANCRTTIDKAPDSYPTDMLFGWKPEGPPHQAEKIADLPRELSASGAPEGADPQVGSLAHHELWGTFATYYRDAPHYDGVIPIGHMADGDHRTARHRRWDQSAPPAVRAVEVDHVIELRRVAGTPESRPAAPTCLRPLFIGAGR